jgi:predicted ABC-type ATPase
MSHTQPQLWVFAGPNGAGKSTLIRRQRFADWMPVVNADDIAAGLRQEQVGDEDAAIIVQAGRLALARRNALLVEGRSFVIETTLTGHSELHLMQAAKARGYKVNLVYVKIASPEQSNSRVCTRVATGGHDVPEPDIFRRFARSLENLPKAIAASNRVRIFENRGKCLKLAELGAQDIAVKMCRCPRAPGETSG